MTTENGSDVVLVSEDASTLELLRAIIAKADGKTVKLIKKKESA